MQWSTAIAKNGEATLSLNGVQLYSRYRPREDAWKWVDEEFDDTKECYLLIGLGLGYHAERLKQLANGKRMYIYYFDEAEYELTPLQEAVSNIEQLNLKNCQILIPSAWVRALQGHVLFPYLEDIKIKQQSFKRFSSMMAANFEQNKRYFTQYTYPQKEKQVAYLVASGPSLNKTIRWLKANANQADIYAVGSALKMLLHHGVIPTGVVISDTQPNIVAQLKGVCYNGILYFLSTANAEAVALHSGLPLPIFQAGYEDAERKAKALLMPTLQTGGSVSTVAISLLEHLQYEKIIMFGQDLGFASYETHATLSTSGRHMNVDSNLRTVISNSGEVIYTTPNLQVYMRWIEEQVKHIKAQLYTTAEHGAAIKGVCFITQQELNNLQ